MKKNTKITNLEQLLERLGQADEQGDRVSIGKMIEVVGRRSFGPLLVFAGIIAVSPLCGIPGVPTAVAVIVLLTTGQLIFCQKHFWLPKWLTQRTVAYEKYCKALKFMRRPARVVDRFIRPRLDVLTGRAGVYIIAIVCMVVAVAMPLMEVIPLTAHLAGVSLTGFGLALIAHDGVMAILAMAFTGLSATLALRTVF